MFSRKNPHRAETPAPKKDKMFTYTTMKVFGFPAQEKNHRNYVIIHVPGDYATDQITRNKIHHWLTGTGALFAYEDIQQDGVPTFTPGQAAIFSPARGNEASLSVRLLSVTSTSVFSSFGPPQD